MALDEGGRPVDIEPRRKRRRRRRRRVVPSPSRTTVVSRGSDSAEAAEFTRSPAYERTRRRDQVRSLRRLGTPERQISAILAGDLDAPAPSSVVRASAYTGPPATSSQVEASRTAALEALIDRLLAGPGGDVFRQSAAAAPSATVSGEAFLGPGLGPLLPIRGGTPASELDAKWLPLDVAGLLPIFRGPRAAATAVDAVRAGERVSGIAKPGSRVASQYREPVVRPLVRRLRGKRGPDEPYEPRSLQVGEREQQLPRARSRITRALIENPADTVSRALDRPSVRAAPVVGRATASMRAAKAAGREEAQEGVRAGAALGEHLNALKVGPLEKGAGVELAHTWWAQLPKTLRNAEGLKLVRARQAEELEEITSGRALQEVERRQADVRAQLDALRKGGAATPEGKGGSLERAFARYRREAAGEPDAMDFDEFKDLARRYPTQVEHYFVDAAPAAAREAGDTERVFDLMREAEELKVLASDLPEQAKDISRSLAALDRVIAKPPPLDPAKIDALDALSRSRKETLIAEGVLDPARAAAREGLVSRWLGLEPTGEEIFFGHRLGKVSGANPSLLPRAVGTGRAKLPQGVSQENKLVLAKTGRTTQTFESAVRDWQAAQVFESTRRVRNVLGEMGDPFAGRVPKDHLLVNLRGRAVPKQWKIIEELGDDLDEDEVRRAASEILAGSFAEAGKQADEMLEAAKKAGVGWDELRVVHKDVAERFFAQFTPAPRGGKGMTAYDRLVDLTAASIVFARLGYIPKNIVQNVILAVPHQGAYLLHNAVRAAQVLRDPQLAPLLRSEVGFSGATRALGKEARTQKAVGKMIGAVGGVADDPLRISAFLHEAAAAGVISRAKPWLTRADRSKLLRLFADKSRRPLLNDVRSRGVEAMGDFQRMTPAQRKAARRLLIIPGWLMAGSRYPFHFAATHPVRSALLAYVAMGEPGAPERLQLNPPIDQLFAEGLPFWAEGVEAGDGKVLRTTSLSPVNTPWDIANALAQRSPETAGGYANPLAAALWHIANREAAGPAGAYPTDFQTSAERNLERLVPNLGFVRDLISPEESKYYPEDATRVGRLERELGVVPIRMTREVSPAQRAEERARASVGEELARARKLFKSVGEKLPDEYGEILQRDLLYDLGREALQEDLDVDKLTEAQEVGLLLSVAFARVPEVEQRQDDWLTAYEEARGDPRDQGDTPSGPMHQFRLRLEDVLGYNRLDRYREFLNRVEDAGQVAANG